jgi:hypothetical protein
MSKVLVLFNRSSYSVSMKRTLETMVGEESGFSYPSTQPVGSATKHRTLSKLPPFTIDRLPINILEFMATLSGIDGMLNLGMSNRYFSKIVYQFPHRGEGYDASYHPSFPLLAFSSRVRCMMCHSENDPMTNKKCRQLVFMGKLYPVKFPSIEIRHFQLESDECESIQRLGSLYKQIIGNEIIERQQSRESYDQLYKFTALRSLSLIDQKLIVFVVVVRNNRNKKFPELESLNFKRVSGNLSSVDWLAQFPRLRHLTFEDCSVHEFEGLSCLTQLQSLHFRNTIAGLSDPEVVLGQLTTLTALKELTPFKPITRVGLAHLQSFSRLRILELNTSPYISDDDLLELKNLPALEVLKFKQCPKITRAGISRLRNLIPRPIQVDMDSIPVEVNSRTCVVS